MSKPSNNPARDAAAAFLAAIVEESDGPDVGDALESFLTTGTTGYTYIDAILKPHIRTDSDFDAFSALVDELQGVATMDWCVHCERDYDSMTEQERALHVCQGEMILRTCNNEPNHL